MKIADIIMHHEKDGKRFSLYKTSQNWGNAVTNIYIDLAQCAALKQMRPGKLRVEVHWDEAESASGGKPQPQEKPDTWEKHFRTA